MSYQDKTIELIQGDGDVKHAIIWLHGLGATAGDFPPVVPQLGLSADRAIRFIFPQAPNRPITVNGGMRMPGWYDIKGMNIADKEDAEGMAESQAILEGLIDDQIKQGIPSENIIVAGFSQGGAVAYHTGVRSKRKLGGIMALSTYLPFSDQIEEEQSKANMATPILAHHGTYDPVVAIHLGKQGANRLIELGYPLTWKQYPMMHQVMPGQIKDIGDWINEVF